MMRRLVPAIRRLVAAGLIAMVGFAATATVGWMLLHGLDGSGSETALLAGMLGSSLAGTVTASTAATGAPVHWSVPSLGLEGNLWPVQLLLAGSPLALLCLAPLLGAIVVGMLAGAVAARRRAKPASVLATAACCYAAVLAAAASMAGHSSQLAGMARSSTSPLLVGVLGAVWVMIAGRMGIAAYRRLVSRRPRRHAGQPRRAVPALAALATAVATFAIAASAPDRGADVTEPGDRTTSKVEPAPVGARRPGVTEALAAIRATSGAQFLLGEDPWRGVPSMLSLRSPTNGDVSTWLRAHAGLFAVADPPSQLRLVSSSRDGLRQRHVWYEQTLQGVPVFGARVGVHLDSSGRSVYAVSNGMLPALTIASTTPTLSPERALAVAMKAMPTGRRVEPPQLFVLASDPYPDRPTPANLVWRIVLSDPTGADGGSWAYFVDAQSSGRIVRAIQVSAPYLDRRVYDYENQPTDPTGPPTRAEGEPATGVADVDDAYAFSGDYYRHFSQLYGRDSWDGNGVPLLTMVRYRRVADEPYLNAFWNGTARTFFGEGMATREIVGHEWTHALIQASADLIYEHQSGALNESFADIFGESIEQFATGSNNWLIGTGSAVGTIRSFSNPPDYDQPDHLRDYTVDCWDGGGVHTNSGISNKAFYVLARRIGMRKAAAISYRSLTAYLDPTSGFTDARNSAIQSAWDLYGKYSDEAAEVWRAWGSVGVDGKAELPRIVCTCFAEASLEGDGVNGLDPNGIGIEQVTSALLRIRDLLEQGGSPALDHYALVYRQANSAAVDLLMDDPDLQRRTAHAMQSFAPVLSAVTTSKGGEVVITQALVDELSALMQAYAAADRERGSGELANLLTDELGRVDTTRLVGMTANQAKIYLDQLHSGETIAGIPGRDRSSTVDSSVQHALARRGHADVIVMLNERADLRGATAVTDHGERAAYVFRRLGLTARRSQQGLVDLLTRSGSGFKQFWIVNAIAVEHASTALVDTLAHRPEVARIRLAGAVALQVADPVAAAASDATGPEWGVARIRAPEVWSQLGTRGDGIVVANIDTGVQFDHPALAHQYRGARADGTVDHNYNWYDPSNVCGDPALGPCDNNDHGTHTMGTMVGSDGTNQIGVAPGATWIAAKGCETSSCSDVALLKAGQWVIAPTDLNGLNPRPDLAPQIVNNSWGGGAGDPFYAEIIDSWVQAGIFPAFANGNAGPRCGTASSPGDDPAAFAVGAFDEANQIASFSSRGPSAFGSDGKPNLAAPGVAVRSSIPGSSYATFSGTSMATPHLAGTVALMWSAAPSLIGDIAATRQLLEDTAIDMADLTCGGTDDDNNVWGEGRLDAYSAVAFSPHGPTGSLFGTVTDSHGSPIAGATVTATSEGRATRTGVTDAAGAYSIGAPTGDYDLTARTFGFRAATATVTVSEGTGTRHDFSLLRVPRYRVSGEVKQGGVGVPSGTVSFVNSSLPPMSIEAGGGFGARDVPAGEYTLAFGGAGCAAPATATLTVDWDESVTIEAPDLVDTSGYRCAAVDVPFPETTTELDLSGDDAAAAITLPFAFPYFGAFYSTAYVSTNGTLNFNRPNPLAFNVALPSIGGPNSAIYPFWDDLVVDAAASVRFAVTGTAPQRSFTVEWRNVTFSDDGDQRITFAVELSEAGQITLHYGRLIGEALAHGGSATVGLEDSSGSLGLQYLFDQPLLIGNTAIQIHGIGMVQGSVTNSDGDPIADAEVESNGARATTDYAGQYRLPLAVGTHTVTFRHTDYQSRSYDVTLSADGAVARLDATLRKLHNVVSGRLADDAGLPLPGITVTAGSYGWPITATTDANGEFRLDDVPPGDYTLSASAVCLNYLSVPVTVDGDMSVELTATRQRDSYGHRCYATPLESVAASDPVALSGDDAVVEVPLPFPLTFYGSSHTSVFISTNGMMSFAPYAAPPTLSDIYNLPSNWAPNDAIYACWDNLTVDASSSVLTSTVGAGADQRFVVEWHNLAIVGTSARITCQAELFADGRIRLQYPEVPTSSDVSGRYVIVAIENPNGTTALKPMSTYASLRSNPAIEIRPPSA